MDFVKEHWLPILLSSLLLAGLISTVILRDNYIDKLSQKDNLIAELSDENSESNDSVNIAENSTTDNDSSEANTTDPADKLPVVVYSPDGLFNATSKTEIKNKLLDPYIDYNNDVGQSIVSISIQAPTGEDAPGPYVVSAIFLGGGYNDFLFGNSQNNTQPWWEPECLNDCDFTPEFKKKYPEIVN